MENANIILENANVILEISGNVVNDNIIFENHNIKKHYSVIFEDDNIVLTLINIRKISRCRLRPWLALAVDCKSMLRVVGLHAALCFL